MRNLLTVLSFVVLAACGCGGGGGANTANVDSEAPAAQPGPRAFVERFVGDEPYFESCPAGSKTLLVWLHSWAADHHQARHLPWLLDLDACIVAPNFGGPNGESPSTCGSAEAIERVARVMAHARAEHGTVNTVVAGASGGAYMALMMAGTHSDGIDKLFVWQPIYDLVRWHASGVPLSLENCFGGPPQHFHDPDYVGRSPRGVLGNARVPTVLIVGGLQDTTTPVWHAQSAFDDMHYYCPMCNVRREELNIAHDFYPELLVPRLAAML